MDLIAFSLVEDPPEIVNGDRDRGWMDATVDRFAYRCLPLNIANQAGWDVLNKVAFTCMWTGGEGKHAIEIQFDGPVREELVSSHFGSGVLTFTLGYLFRTPPGHNLWAMGTPNFYKDGIAPLSGIIETDWAPYTFTMNWKITRPRHPIRFEVGDPFCRIMPMPRSYLADYTPRIESIHADKDTYEQYMAWRESRMQFNKDLHVEGSEARKAKWQRDYMRGKDTKGQMYGEHETKLRLRPFNPDRKK